MESSFSYALVTFLTSFASWQAYAIILGVLLACGLGLPIPEDITLLAAGVLSALGTISFPGALAAGFFGVLAGDAFLFMLGRKLGHRVFKLPGFRKIFTEKRIRMAEEKIIANSKFICFTARFLPGLRSPIYLTSGILGVKPLVFFALDGFAALISVPVWIYVGWYFGNNLDTALEKAKEMQIIVLIGVVLLIAGYIGYKKWLRSRGSSPAPSKPQI